MNDATPNPLAIFQSLPKAFEPPAISALLGAKALDPSTAASALKNYLVDAAERTILFLDLLRQRGKRTGRDDVPTARDRADLRP